MSHFSNYKEKFRFLQKLWIPNLQNSQWWSLDRLQEFQNARLREMVRYAYHTIPAYRETFDRSGVRPEQIRTVADLLMLPITERAEFQNNPDYVNPGLITDTLHTGGSTGNSLEYYESALAGRMRWDAHRRGWEWGGYLMGKTRLAVLTSAQGVVPGKQTLNLAGDLSLSSLRENLHQINEFAPECLRGYVSSIVIFAQYCLDQGVTFPFLRKVNVISENLYPEQRSLIEKALNAEVYEEYVCNDGGACAWECEQHFGLHYCMERAVIENIDGEMIVTDLWNRAMPFIRYRNGDAVEFIPERCSCGRALPLIKVRGRTNDVIVSRDRLISPTFLLHHGIGLVGVDRQSRNFNAGISAVQYVQKPGFVLIVFFVRNEHLTTEALSVFKEKVCHIVGDMVVRFIEVQTLPSSPKGKRQFIINEDKDLLQSWQR